MRRSFFLRAFAISACCGGLLSAPASSQTYRVRPSCPEDPTHWTPPQCGSMPRYCNEPCYGPTPEYTTYSNCLKKKNEVEKHNRELKQCGADGDDGASPGNSGQRAAPTPPAPSRGAEATPSPAEPSAFQRRLENASRKLGPDPQRAKQDVVDRAKNSIQSVVDAANEKKMQEEEAQREEQRRNEEQLANAAKWRCFGGPDEIRTGYRQCVSECGLYFRDGQCRRECDDEGHSIGMGRSCYKRP